MMHLGAVALVSGYQLHSSYQPGTAHHRFTRATPHIVASLAPSCAIKVIGIGGGGSNAVNRMMDNLEDEDDRDVEFVCMNTDVQALDRSCTQETLQLGPECTRGLGAGGKPEVGEAAAQESREAIATCCAGQDMVFVTAGMGGGTGSGAAPVVAQIAREAGALTVAVVSKPFGFEGARRGKQAAAAVERLSASVDMIVVVSNDRLLEIIPPGVSLIDSFALADEAHIHLEYVRLHRLCVAPTHLNTSPSRQPSPQP